MITPKKFRPHHFLCALGFAGKGYSDSFTENLRHIVNELRSTAGDAILLEVVKNTDDICTPCPHKRDQQCTEQAKIDQLDTAHAAALNIQPGDILSWKTAKNRIASKISLKTFEKICAPCAWKTLGVCEKALLDNQQRSL